ncbi:phage tail tip fiber protein, partial [Pseudomonas protegens]
NKVYIDSLFIKDGAIDNAKIKGAIQSDVKDSQGRPLWILDKSGGFSTNSAGDGGRIEQRADVIKVYDAANKLRVKIGNLS